MNSSTFEFRGNNQFFKYRFVKEFTANFGSIDDYWVYFPSEEIKYRLTADFLYRAFNIRVNFDDHKIDNDDTILLGGLKNEHKDKHVFMIPTSSLFFHDNSNWYLPSSVVDVSETVIVSVPIKTVVSSGLSFLATDTPVIILIGMSVMVVSSLITLNWTLIGGKKLLRKIASKLFHNIWENSSLLCAEPIARISADITSRLITLTWLVGVTFVLFFINCFMKTEFSIETYQTIDSLSQLVASGVKPQILKDSRDECNWVNNDPVIKAWFAEIAKDKSNFIDIGDLYHIDGYDDLMWGEKVLIISKKELMWGINQVSDTSPLETAQLIGETGGIYFSNAIHSNYRHYVYNKSFVESSPEMREIAQISFYPFFESKPFAYLDFELEDNFDSLVWTKTDESASDLGISALVVPFYFLFALLLLSSSVVTLEILFPKQDGRRDNNSRTRYAW